MARPGQAAHRAAKKAAQTERALAATADDEVVNTTVEEFLGDFGDEDEEDVEAAEGIAGQALPVAELPEDFDGEATDGATFLALAIRANANLPLSTRVEPPVAAVPRRKVPPVEEVAGRHGALPQESWDVVFAAHFAAYRKETAERWPPSPPLQPPADYLPMPSFKHSEGWLAYINGQPVPHWIEGGLSKKNIEAKKAKEVALDDEEMAMNGAPPPKSTNGESDMDMDDGASLDLDDEAQPREPLVSLLSRLDTSNIMSIIRHMLHWTRTALTQLQAMEKRDPDTFAQLQPDPFPPVHARWAFALLTILDAYLVADDMHTLRNFARVLGDVAVWRYTVGVRRGELAHLRVRQGFYSDPDEAATGAWAGVVEARQQREAEASGEAWRLGARWKDVRDLRPRSELTPRPESDEARADAAAVDECLSRAWLVANAIAAGWAQWDLRDDWVGAFRRVKV